MREEIWKDVKGFEGYYKVSSFGRILGLKRKYSGEHFMSPALDSQGYLVVCLRKPGYKGNKKVHRLVAEAFLPNPNNLPEVNHKDEDKTNNNLDNLEWCTSKYNINYGFGIQRRIETIAKNGGRIQTEETRQKIREKAIGRCHSEETRKKMSISQKKRWNKLI